MGTKSCLVDIGGEQFLSSDKLKQQMIEIFTGEAHSPRMEDRIRDTEAIQLCKKIDTCLCEGPKMLLRCKKIRDGLAMFRTKPVVFYQLSECRKLLLELLHQQVTLFFFQLGMCTAGADLQKELAFKMMGEPSTVDGIFDTIKDILLDGDNLKSREVDINLVMRRLKYVLS
ncbi:hypothetical protein ACF0H5_005803 [Mactra antiquata]